MLCGRFSTSRHRKTGGARMTAQSDSYAGAGLSNPGELIERAEALEQNGDWESAASLFAVAADAAPFQHGRVGTLPNEDRWRPDAFRSALAVRVVDLYS